jgi:hypothetical protein
MLNWLKAIFAPEDPLPVVRPRPDSVPDVPVPQYVRNFRKTPEQRSAEAKAGHVTRAANKAKAG